MHYYITRNTWNMRVFFVVFGFKKTLLKYKIYWGQWVWLVKFTSTTKTQHYRKSKNKTVLYCRGTLSQSNEKYWVIILESKNLPIYSITTTTKDIAQSFQSMVCHLYLLDFKRRAIRSVESSLKIWEHIATRQKKCRCIVHRHPLFSLIQEKTLTKSLKILE